MTKDGGVKVTWATLSGVVTLIALISVAANFFGSRALAGNETKQNTAGIVELRQTDKNMTQLLNNVQTRQEVQEVHINNLESNVVEMKGDLKDIKGDIKKLLERKSV